MALIKYVGNKARKQDTVAGTGIWWEGHGDVQDVPDKLVARLLLHPDVWARAEVGENAGLGTLTSGNTGSAAPVGNDPDPFRFVLDGPDGPVVFDAMDDDAVKAWIKTNLEPHGIKVDGRAKGDKLKAAVIEAVKSAGAEG